MGRWLKETQLPRNSVYRFSVCFFFKYVYLLGLARVVRVGDVLAWRSRIGLGRLSPERLLNFGPNFFTQKISDPLYVCKSILKCKG
jgi:hypothetical protein